MISVQKEEKPSVLSIKTRASVEMLACLSEGAGGERYCHNADRMERRVRQTERMHELLKFVRVNATALGYVAEAASQRVVLQYNHQLGIVSLPMRSINR